MQSISLLDVGADDTSDRYERLFDSIDSKHKQDGRLHSLVVEQIWSRSRLPFDRLSTIWTTCGGSAAGLHRDGFARGARMIDEALGE